ncbi:MAG: hypothetical protein ACUVV6_09505, partial [Thermoplasmatota archaeon]
MRADGRVKRLLGALTALLLFGGLFWPVLATAGEPKAGPRAIVDDGSDLIVPEGESYELSGCHTYT